MTTLLDTLTVKLLGDTSDYVAKFDHAQQKTQQFSKMATVALAGVGVAAVAAFAVATKAMADYASDAVKGASDLSETVNKTSVVFGTNAKAMMAWSMTSASALGLSRNEALSAAATFGNLFVSMGMGQDVASEMSMNLVKLAADMGSFNNLDPNIVLEKLRSGLTGEIEPLKALGVNFNAAMVAAKAMEMGLASSTDALTPAMEAQARYALILEQTKIQQGDYSNTSQNLANQQRTLAKNMENLQATIGEGLLPIWTEATRVANQFVSGVLPYVASIISNVVAPAISDAVQRFDEWIQAMTGGFDNSEASVKQFTEQFVQSLNFEIDSINRIIESMAIMANMTQNELARMGWYWEDFTINLAVQVNRIVGALNTVIEGMNAVGKFGNPTNPSIPGVPEMAVPPSRLRPPLLSTNAAQLEIPRLGHIEIQWQAVGNAAANAASTAKTAITDATSTAGKTVSTAVKGMADDLVAKFKGAMQQIPGLFGASAVTETDMARARAGLSNNYVDDYLRQARDEMLNGVDYQNIDPAEVAKSVGLSLEVPVEVILAELERQWNSGQYFADPENLKKLNWDAARSSLQDSLKAELGQANLMAEAIKQGITPESWKGLTDQIAQVTKDGIPRSFDSLQIGAAIGDATVTAVGTPAAVSKFQSAGESAFTVWLAGWNLAASNANWPPPPPAPNSPPSSGGSPGNVPPASGLGAPTSGSGNVPPASGLGTSQSSGGDVNVTINVTGDAYNGTRRGVLAALRAKGL